MDHALLILLIATLTWLLTSLVQVAERRTIIRYGRDDEISDADRQWRRIRTQVTVLRRLAIAVVVILGVAAILMTFPSFTDIGTTVFASAGVLSVVAGLAAQTSLGAVFAGMQIAFSGAIRVGDVVQLEDGQWWGRIEEITLSYVVVRLWDERGLVLPCTYFTTEPFENWTRSATEIMGTVEFDVDFSVPFNDMRAELDRLLADSELWDGRRGVLQVTDAVGGVVRVRTLVSAPNAGALFDLRCAVREGWSIGCSALGRGADATHRAGRARIRARGSPRRRARRRGWRRACSPAAPRPTAGTSVRRRRRPRGRFRQAQRPRLTSQPLTGVATRAVSSTPRYCGASTRPAASSGSVLRSVLASTNAPSSAGDDREWSRRGPATRPRRAATK